MSRYHRILSAVLAVMMFTVQAQGSEAVTESESGRTPAWSETVTVSDLEAEGAQLPAMQYRPYARWWLAEGSHTDETIVESVKELYESGFGGIEFVTLTSEAQVLDDETYGWGSAEWVHDSRLILSECARYGMSVSMTGGTYWATANLPDITPDDPAASQELGYKTVELTGEKGEKTAWSGALPLCELPDGVTKQRLVAVVAGRVTHWSEGKKDATCVDGTSLRDITASVTGEGTERRLSFEAEDDGDYILYVFWQYGTGECYGASSAGVNYTINYLDEAGADAFIRYWEEEVLTDEVQEIIDQIDECDLYMDSLELNTKGADSAKQLWCEDMTEQFLSRRGYDLTPYLPALIRKTPNNSAGMGRQIEYVYDISGPDGVDLEKLRNEFFQTQTELYTANCLEKIADWLHAHHMYLRAEVAYGKTLEVSQSAAAVDFPETESLEFGTEIDAYRNFSGAAHLLGKRLSSETGAAMFANYKWDNRYYRRMAYLQYASGIQKTVVHGYSSAYGPEESVSWPGYEGMEANISERFNARQPSSADFAEVNMHLARLEEVLLSGVPQTDIAILRTDYYLNNLHTGVTNAGIETGRLFSDDAYYWKDLSLQKAGYTYDYFSPLLLTNPSVSAEDGLINSDGVAYQAVIVMEDELPTEAAQVLLEAARNGLPVVFVDNVTEEVNNSGADKVNTQAASVTGYNDGQDEALADIIREMKSLENVRTADGTAAALSALEDLGVQPRCRVTKESAEGDVLTVLRKDGERRYLYVFNYRFDEDGSFCGNLTVCGGSTVSELDTWTGAVSAVTEAAPAGSGRTVIPAEIAPGDVKVYILEQEERGDTAESSEEETAGSADGITAADETSAAEDAAGRQESEILAELTAWDLTVDVCLPGEAAGRTEENPDTGVTTTEVTWTTHHEVIDCGTLEELISWNGIAQLGPEVSGTGLYSTVFTLPETGDRQILFAADDLGGGTAALWVNGERVSVNMDSGCANITGCVKAGENTICVRITTSLRNLARTMDEADWLKDSHDPGADTYGMTGSVRILAAA